MIDNGAWQAGLPWVWEFPWGSPYPWEWDGNGNQIFPYGDPHGNLHRNPHGIFEYGFIRSSLINIGFTMGFLMGLLWDSSYGIPYGITMGFLMGIPMRIPYGDSHRIPMGMGWEWEPKFHSHGNRALASLYILKCRPTNEPYLCCKSIPTHKIVKLLTTANNKLIIS